MRHFLFSLFALALLATSCGDDSSTASPSTTDDAVTTAGNEVTAPVDDPATDPPPTDDNTAALDDQPLAELTASWTGVTEDVIRVGVLSIDWEALAAAGVATSRTNVDEIFASPLLAINEAGGIHGRMLEIVNVPVHPLGSESADAACLQLTEDNPVFIVIGSTRSNLECYTELNETAVLAISGMTPERLAGARAPFATVQASADAKAVANIAALAEVGAFDGEVVGLTGAADASATPYLQMQAALDAAGLDYVDALVAENDGDVAASQADGDVINELFISEGVTVVINTTGVAAGLASAAENPTGARQIILPLVGARDLLAAGYDLTAFNGALSVVETPAGTTEQPAMADDPIVAECVGEIAERTGEPISFSLDVDTDLIGAINGCSMAIILEQALLNAGPELTHESLQAGLEAIGEIELPGYGLGQLGPGDMDAANERTIVEFDSELGAWVPIEGGVR